MKLIDLYSKIVVESQRKTDLIEIDNLAFKFQKNGNLLEIGKYENEKQNGVWVIFNENGNLLCIGNWINGKKHGKWEHFDKSGSLITIKYWSNGEFRTRR